VDGLTSLGHGPPAVSRGKSGGAGAAYCSERARDFRGIFAPRRRSRSGHFAAGPSAGLGSGETSPRGHVAAGEKCRLARCPAARNRPTALVNAMATVTQIWEEYHVDVTTKPPRTLASRAPSSRPSSAQLVPSSSRKVLAEAKKELGSRQGPEDGPTGERRQPSTLLHARPQVHQPLPQGWQGPLVRHPESWNGTCPGGSGKAWMPTCSCGPTPPSAGCTAT